MKAIKTTQTQWLSVQYQLCLCSCLLYLDTQVQSSLAKLLPYFTLGPSTMSSHYSVQVVALKSHSE